MPRGIDEVCKNYLCLMFGCFDWFYGTPIQYRSYSGGTFESVKCMENSCHMKPKLV